MDHNHRNSNKRNGTRPFDYSSKILSYSTSGNGKETDDSDEPPDDIEEFNEAENLLKYLIEEGVIEELDIPKYNSGIRYSL